MNGGEGTDHIKRHVRPKAALELAPAGPSKTFKYLSRNDYL